MKFVWQNNYFCNFSHYILCISGQGQYGCVWKGVLHDREVAVKIFPSHYRQYFLNERDIYCLPFMDNPALLTYFGKSKFNLFFLDIFNVSSRIFINNFG